MCSTVLKAPLPSLRAVLHPSLAAVARVWPRPLLPVTSTRHAESALATTASGVLAALVKELAFPLLPLNAPSLALLALLTTPCALFPSPAVRCVLATALNV
jgi:hypothetical protein